MKRFFVNQLVLAALLVSAVLTSCNNNEEEKEDLASTGTLTPPEWTFGVWEDKETGSIEDPNLYEFLFDDVKIGVSFAGSCITASLIELYEAANVLVGDLGTIKVKEIRKNDYIYEIGVEYKKNNQTVVEAAYNIKIGDGSFIEIAVYDTDTKKYGSFIKFTKEEKIYEKSNE